MHTRTRSASTIYHFSAQAAYHRNNTEAFSDAKLNTEEDVLYIMRLARAEDASGTIHKFHDDLLAFKKQAADDAHAKQQAKVDDAATRIIELRAITVIIDPAALVKLKKDALQQQLDVQQELLKEEVISKAKLKDMKNKPDMLAAIVDSDKWYVPASFSMHAQFIDLII